MTKHLLESKPVLGSNGKLRVVMCRVDKRLGPEFVTWIWDTRYDLQRGCSCGHYFQHKHEAEQDFDRRN